MSDEFPTTSDGKPDHVAFASIVDDMRQDAASDQIWFRSEAAADGPADPAGSTAVHSRAVVADKLVEHYETFVVPGMAPGTTLKNYLGDRAINAADLIAAMTTPAGPVAQSMDFDVWQGYHSGEWHSFAANGSVSGTFQDDAWWYPSREQRHHGDGQTYTVQPVSWFHTDATQPNFGQVKRQGFNESHLSSADFWGFEPKESDVNAHGHIGAHLGFAPDGQPDLILWLTKTVAFLEATAEVTTGASTELRRISLALPHINRVGQTDELDQPPGGIGHWVIDPNPTSPVKATPTAMGSRLASTPRTGLMLLFCAEGYEPTEKRQFKQDVRRIWRKLKRISPLEQLDKVGGNATVLVWAHDQRAKPFAVTPSGPEGRPEADPDAVLAHLNAIQIPCTQSGDSYSAGRDFVYANNGATGHSGALMVIVTKDDLNLPDGEYVGGRADVPYHVVVSAADERKAAAVVARGIGRVFGLADNSPSAPTPWFQPLRRGHNVMPELEESRIAGDIGLWPIDRWAPFRFGGGASDFAIIDNTPMALDPIDVVVHEQEWGPLSSAAFPFVPGAIAQPTIDQQSLRYDEAGFAESQLTAGTTHSQAVSAHGTRTDWWKYSVAPDTVGGFRVVDAVVETLMHMPGGMSHRMDQPVAESIEFRDFVATLHDGDAELAVPVSLDSALQTQWWQGSTARDATYQEGVKFKAIVAVEGPTSGKGVLLEIETAVAFRYPEADFDPPRAVEAMLFFPQFSVRQLTAKNLRTDWSLTIDELGVAFDVASSTTLIEFTGAIRTIADIHSPSMMISHMHAELPGVPANSFATGNVNYAAAFSDMHNLVWNVTTGSLQSHRELLSEATAGLALSSVDPLLAHTVFAALQADLPSDIADTIRLALAAWYGMFDMVERLDDSGVAFDAVYAHGHPRASGGLRWGTVNLPWPNHSQGSLNRTIYREARQGAYDNCHIHGTMGTVLDADASNPAATPRVMAPGCGHSCFHTHWRWGNSTYFLSVDAMMPVLLLAVALGDAGPAISSAFEDNLPAMAEAILQSTWPLTPGFKGWSDDGRRSRRHEVIGAPLMPPNQSLEVRIGGSPQPDGTLDVTTTSPMITTQDQIVTVDCRKRRGWSSSWRHCAAEYGSGVAVRYTRGNPATTMFQMVLAAYHVDPAYLPVIGSGYSESRIFTEAYDVIPFLESLQWDSLVHASARGATPLIASSQAGLTRADEV